MEAVLGQEVGGRNYVQGAVVVGVVNKTLVHCGGVAAVNVGYGGVADANSVPMRLAVH